MNKLRDFLGLTLVVFFSSGCVSSPKTPQLKNPPAPVAERTKEVLAVENGRERHWVIKSGGLIIEEHGLTAHGNLHIAFEYPNGVRFPQIDSPQIDKEVHSIVKVFWPNGKLMSKTSQVGGKPDGEDFTWWPNGEIAREAHFVAGQPSNTWKFYNESGQLVGEGTYIFGQRQNGIFIGSDSFEFFLTNYPMKKRRIENGVVKEESDFLMEPNFR